MFFKKISHYCSTCLKQFESYSQSQISESNTGVFNQFDDLKTHVFVIKM